MTAFPFRSRHWPATAALVLVFTLAISPLSANAADGPATLIASLGHQGIEALGNDVPTPDRLARLSELFQQDFDVSGIGLFALGRYRQMATPQQLEEYFRIYPQFTVWAFNNRLDDYRGARFVVTGKRRMGRETVISTEIQPPGGRVQVDWYLIKSGPGHAYRIIDVSIAGTSMIAALRDRFATWIEGNGGQFSALLIVMRQMMQSG